MSQPGRDVSRVERDSWRDLAADNARAADRYARENEALRAALAFYAAPENYQPTGWQGDPNPPAIVADAGGKARAALGQTVEPSQTS